MSIYESDRVDLLFFATEMVRLYLDLPGRLCVGVFLVDKGEKRRGSPLDSRNCA